MVNLLPFAILFWDSKTKAEPGGCASPTAPYYFAGPKE